MGDGMYVALLTLNVKDKKNPLLKLIERGFL